MGGTNVDPTATVIEELVELEHRVEAAVESVLSSPAHAQAEALATELGATSRRHREDLEHQRDRIAPGALSAELPGSRSVARLYAALSEAVFAYADMHARAHRDFDSQSEGNTAALAESHMQTYGAAIQQLNLLVSDITVNELGTRAIYCQCQCPACAFGLCLCSPHGSATVQEVMQKAVPEPAEAGVRVRRPRLGSEAERAALVDGDRVAAIDNQEIRSDLDIGTVQGAIRVHASGDTLELLVIRSDGETVRLTARRP
jgi:hypothetical protein